MSNRDPLYKDPTHTDPFQAAQRHDTGAGGKEGQSRNASGQAKAKGEQAMDKASEKGQQAMDQAGQKGEQAKAKASQAADQAHAKADQGMDKAASGMDQAADKLRERGDRQGGSVGSVASTAADTMESASSYLHDKDTNQLMDDLEAMIRRKPTESLLVAAGVGFVLSKIFR